jgi:hypothetical protein
VRYYWLALGILSVWRITHLLNAEDGPADLLVRFRRLAGAGIWGSLLDCFNCLSLWIAVPFALWLGEDWRERFLLWLGLSAGAILLQRSTAPAPQAIYKEDEVTDHVVLRKEQESISGNGPGRGPE